MNKAAPLQHNFFTPNVWLLIFFMGAGAVFAFFRFFYGFGSVTNLNAAYPFGIWIAFDVACGVALAAGGFTTAAIVEIFGRDKYHALVRPAILLNCVASGSRRAWNQSPLGESQGFQVRISRTFWFFTFDIAKTEEIAGDAGDDAASRSHARLRLNKEGREQHQYVVDSSLLLHLHPWLREQGCDGGCALRIPHRALLAPRVLRKSRHLPDPHQPGARLGDHHHRHLHDLWCSLRLDLPPVGGVIGGG